MSELAEAIAWAGRTPPPEEAGLSEPVRSVWDWATVESLSPLRVRLDGSRAYLPAESLVSGLRLLSRVWVQVVGSTVVVHGRKPDDTGWVDIPIAVGFAAQSTNERPQVRGLGDKVYARGGWSNTGMSTNATFTVGTIPAGLFPAGMNALWRWGTSNGDAGAAAIVSYTNGGIQIRTGSTLSAYFIFPAGTFWPRY